MGEQKRAKVAGLLALVAGVLFMLASLVSGKLVPLVPIGAFWLMIGALWLMIGAGVIGRGRASVPSSEGTGAKPFDKALAACLIAGAILGMLLTTVADIRSSTVGPLPPPGDTVTPVTSTYSVFGVAVKESTGAWGADESRRFSQFHSLVGLAFVITGMVAGLVVYLIGFRPRGGPDPGVVAKGGA